MSTRQGYKCPLLSYFLLKNQEKSATMVDGKYCEKTQVIHKYWRKSCLFLI